MKTFDVYLKKAGMDGIVKKLDAQAEIPSSGLTTGNLSKHCQFWCLPLASSIKSSSFSIPQKFQAMTNCTLKCLSGWPPCSRNPLQIYSTTHLLQLLFVVIGRRQLLYSRKWTTAQWTWPRPKWDICAFLGECNVITGCQHGFLLRRSCLSRGSTNFRSPHTHGYVWISWNPFFKFRVPLTVRKLLLVFQLTERRPTCPKFTSQVTQACFWKTYLGFNCFRRCLLLGHGEVHLRKLRITDSYFLESHQ